MGIGDDIKPQKEDSLKEIDTENALEGEDIAEEARDQSESETNSEKEGSVEIPIDKTGKTPPVYEDIFKDNKAPFEHLTDKNPQTIKEEKNEQDKGKAIDGLPPASEPKKKSHILRNIIIVICVLILAFIVYSNIDNIKTLLGSESPAETGDEGTSGVEIISGQDYTSVNSESTDSEENNSPSSSTETTETENTDTVEPQPTTTEPSNETASFDKSALSIRVLNGNGVNGSAAVLADILRADGYTIAEVTNASRFTYENTTIYYGTGKLEAAEAVKVLLSDYSVLSYENPTVVANYDLIIVTGKE